MSFSDHKITQFTHRITELPDQPNLPADELKARFDSSPEELRTAHNAVCDDAQTLSDKVESIITQTFEGTIDREMLSDELEADLTALETAVPLKCEAYFGYYTGNGGSTQQIDLGFAPKAVLVINPYDTSETTDEMNFCSMGMQGNPTVYTCVYVNETGFLLRTNGNIGDGVNKYNRRYFYAAFK
ncbi:MAG TPA: hypothetical protein H9739_02280 [Candidatus Agathobaculum pullistercoris]|nr:hypothetical protein [Candidatus Agathobaculum pullistercoris]